MPFNGGRVLSEAQRRAETIVTRALLGAETGAKTDTRTPVDTGAHRNSIFSKVERQGNTIIGQFGATQDYSIWIEMRHATGAGVLQEHWTTALGQIREASR